MSTVPDGCDADEDPAPRRLVPPGRRRYAERAVDDIARARRAAGADWPAYDPGADRGLAGQDWQGRARCAAARQAAGVPLDELDQDALARVGDAAGIGRTAFSSRLGPSAA